MPIPVQIPVGAFVIDDSINAKAELLVQVLTQIFKYGTTGATITTPPTLYPDGVNPEIDPLTGRPRLKALTISTPEQQLYYRQLALAVVGVIEGGGVLPPSTPQLTTFGAECPSTAMVGDLVYVSGPGEVALADYTDSAKLPAVGCITAKSDAITATIQTHGVVVGAYAGLSPGAMYCIGSNSRPALQVSPGVGQSLFYQAIGVALDPVTMVLSPSIMMTRVRG